MTSLLFDTTKIITPFLDYFCVFSKKNKLITHNQYYNVVIVNEHTKQKIVMNNIMCNNKKELIYFKQNGHDIEYKITPIIQNIIQKMNWDINKHIIYFANNEISFSYGVEYFFIKDKNDNIIDICTKNSTFNTFSPLNTNHDNYVIYNYEWFCYNILL
jgi:hypothetical protein